MKTILVSGASGIVGYGILNSLAEVCTNLKLIGTSIYKGSVAKAFCDKFELAPKTEHTKKYYAWLNRMIKKHSIDLLIPGIEVDAYSWNENRKQINAQMMLNSYNLLNLCQDKWKFYKKLNRGLFRGVGLTIPTFLASEFIGEAKEFNKLKKEFNTSKFIVKPRFGCGSKGIVRFSTADQFIEIIKTASNDLLQPLVGQDNQEYTVGAFGNGEGKSLARIILKRKLYPDFGFTGQAEVILEDKEIDQAIHDLCVQFRPLGPTNFQFRKTESGLKLLEINPRISSSTSIRTAFNYNESYMAVEYFLNSVIPEQPKLLEGSCIRYSEDLIFYKEKKDVKLK